MVMIGMDKTPYRRHGGSVVVDPDGVPVGVLGRTKASRWRAPPLRLQWRQVAPIHAGDVGEMQEKWVTRRRYTRWNTGWAGLLREAKRNPWAEWQLVEDLLPRVGAKGPRPGQLRWSQICRSCQQWGVWPEPGTDRAHCVRCGADAAPAACETTIGPLRVPSIDTTCVSQLPGQLPCVTEPTLPAPPDSIAWAWPPRRPFRHKRHPDYALWGLRRDR